MNTVLRRVVFFVALVGLAYVSHTKMIRPANAEMASQKTRLIEKQAKLAKLQSAPAAAEELKAQLDRLSQAVVFFESKLPPASEIDSVLENVTIIAKRNNLASNMIKTLRKKSNNGYFELPLKMELSGNFKSFYSFLLELEQLDRITKIRELTLSKNEEEQGRVDASFTISIFYR